MALLSAAEDIKKAAAAEEEKRLEEEIASGAFFECGCCFGETALSQLSECRTLDRHLSSQADIACFSILLKWL